VKDDAGSDAGAESGTDSTYSSSSSAETSDDEDDNDGAGPLGEGKKQKRLIGAIMGFLAAGKRARSDWKVETGLPLPQPAHCRLRFANAAGEVSRRLDFTRWEMGSLSCQPHPVFLCRGMLCRTLRTSLCMLARLAARARGSPSLLGWPTSSRMRRNASLVMMQTQLPQCCRCDDTRVWEGRGGEAFVHLKSRSFSI
jgi:hypothetical protein